MVEHSYAQPTLDGCEMPGDSVQVVVDTRLMVLSEPEYTRRRVGEEWTCTAHAMTWYRDRDEIYALSAHADRARRANGCHVHPGDQIRITGVPKRQIARLGGGRESVVIHVSLAGIAVVSRVPEVSRMYRGAGIE